MTKKARPVEEKEEGGSEDPNNAGPPARKSEGWALANRGSENQKAGISIYGVTTGIQRGQPERRRRAHGGLGPRDVAASS